MADARHPTKLQVLIAITIVAIAIAVAGGIWERRERFTLDQTSSVRSALDGSSYRVHGQHHNPGAAANTLAELNGRTVELLRHLRRKYTNNTVSPARAAATERLLRLYNPDNLAENSPHDPDGDTSYTIDKGAIVALCLRAGDGQQLHDTETLTFVSFHELAHIAIEDMDHPPRFWQTFKFLLEEAHEAGLTRAVDYGVTPVTYCGGRMEINYNPLYDVSLHSVV